MGIHTTDRYLSSGLSLVSVSYDHTLIFLHVPKTGGSTLNHVVDWNYERVYRMQYYHQIADFVALPAAQKRQYDCLRNGFYYGIHEHLPQQATYIAMLRHPIDRFVSAYYYTMARRRREGLPDPDASMEQLLEQEPFQAHMQLSLLRGAASIDEALHTPLQAGDVGRAQQHIEDHFALAGVLDYYDQSLLLMQRKLGWSRVFYSRRNTRRAATPPLPATLQRELEAICEPALEFYAWATQRLEAEIAAQGEAFATDLADLRRSNQRFERFYRLSAPLRGTPLWKSLRRSARQLLRSGD
jgi:hypothetical protein